MGRVVTNGTSLAIAREASLGVLPGSPEWRLVEPNGINRWGAQISKTARSPISKARQRRKGVITDLSSAVEIEADVTLTHLKDFLETFLFSRAVGPDAYNPSAAVTGGFTVAALSAAQAGRFKYVTAGTGATTLVYSRGFSNSANNGLDPITAAVATSATTIPTAGNVAETPAATQSVEVAIAGVRAASGDLAIDAQGNLTSTALDFTTLGLTVGQFIHVGGVDVLNQFANTANLGFARVMAITATKLTLDKKATTFVADTGTGVRVDILFGQFIRNVDIGHADYLEVSSQVELTLPNLGTAGATNYEYSIGNFADALSVNLGLNDKATMTFGWVGIDTGKPTASRATNAANAREPGQTNGFSTASDVARLRVLDVDQAGLTSDFKSMTFTLTNNVSPEKVIGKLAAQYMNVGDFEVDVDATAVFSNPDVIERIRCNKTVSLDWALWNGDGACYIDLPAGTLSGGDRAFPVNQSVTISVPFAAHKDPTLGFSLSASFFPVLPARPCQ